MRSCNEQRGFCWNSHYLAAYDFTSKLQEVGRARAGQMPDVPHHPERRRYPRIRAKIPVELLCPGAAPMRITTDEISLCGCYVETMFTMEVGTKLTIKLSIGGEAVNASGVVVTKYPQVGNGIDFTQMHPNDSRKLSEFVLEHQ
jgi:c-di-GMP-binding flagellar brake protein YcgR